MSIILIFKYKGSPILLYNLPTSTDVIGRHCSLEMSKRETFRGKAIMNTINSFHLH